jgi:hypothetical protein
MKTLILFAVLVGACLVALPQEASARCRGGRCGKAPRAGLMHRLVPGPRVGGCQNGSCR